jgi:hypothetical protein
VDNHFPPGPPPPTAAANRPTSTGCSSYSSPADRLDGLADEPRPGAHRKITDEQVENVLGDTLEAAPGNATHWSRASMAKNPD